MHFSVLEKTINCFRSISFFDFQTEYKKGYLKGLVAVGCNINIKMIFEKMVA